MNTQTHIIMGAALFGGRVPAKAWAGALGGITPDVPMLLIVMALKVFSVPDELIFGTLYWQNWWQVTNAIGHNFWLWGALLVLALTMRERQSASVAAIDGWTIVFAFAAAGFVHAVIDFLCHREDAHMSFWPVSRWKFMSPVSYWDVAHYGRPFMIFEVLLGLVLAVVLFSRFRNPWVRTALSLAMLLYVAVPAYFLFT